MMLASCSHRMHGCSRTAQQAGPAACTGQRAWKLRPVATNQVKIWLSLLHMYQNLSALRLQVNCGSFNDHAN